MKKRKRGGIFATLPEFIIALVIALIAIRAAAFDVDRNNHMVDQVLEILMIPHREVLTDSTNHAGDPEFKKLITEFRPNIHRMVEVYNEDFELEFRFQFQESSITHQDLTQFPKLCDYFANHEAGNTHIDVNKSTTDIFFSWVTSDKGRELFVMYVEHPVDKAAWRIPVMCFSIVFLVFILVTIIMYRNTRNTLESYQRATNDLYRTKM